VSNPVSEAEAAVLRIAQRETSPQFAGEFEPPISSDNLLGIKYLRRFDPVADLARLGFQSLSFQESLERLRHK
jgi:hypothetical protein